jgi:hypothetical protein
MPNEIYNPNPKFWQYGKGAVTSWELFLINDLRSFFNAGIFFSVLKILFFRVGKFIVEKQTSAMDFSNSLFIQRNMSNFPQILIASAICTVIYNPYIHPILYKDSFISSIPTSV